MSFLCEWNDCTFSSDDFDLYYSHVREHTRYFMAGNDSSDQVVVTCQWRECFAESCESGGELTRHVLFHGYHAKLKYLGLKAQNSVNLSPCLLDSQERNCIPEFTEDFRCQWEHCDEVTYCPKYFYRHLEIHIEDAKPQDSFRLFKCKWNGCEFMNNRRNKLKDHCRTHTHEKAVACPNCGGLFANKTKFMDHLRRQNTMESESYQCSHCFKFFASERILRDHMRQHVNYHRCSLCNITCPTKSALQHHVNFRHSTEKPFPCDICDSSFKTINDLGRHQQTHDPVYNFNCEEPGCPYVSNTLHNLRRHYKTNHENQCGGRYECHICGHRYTRGTSLTTHLKTIHTFRWPTGHNRFRYKEYEDGLYRLQTVRFESVELSQQMDALENVASLNGALPHFGQEVSVSGDLVQTEIEETNGSDSPTFELTGYTTVDTASTVTHGHLLDMLNKFTEGCGGQSDGQTCDEKATEFSESVTTDVDIKLTHEPRKDTVITRASLDLQEAASVLAQLSDSTISCGANFN